MSAAHTPPRNPHGTPATLDGISAPPPRAAPPPGPKLPSPPPRPAPPPGPKLPSPSSQAPPQTAVHTKSSPPLPAAPPAPQPEHRGNWLKRCWHSYWGGFREHKAKRITQTLAVLLVLAALGLGLRLWWLSSQITARNTGDTAAALQENVDPTALRGEGDGRVNIVLIGIDDVGEGLADSLMLVSIDPFAHEAAMLSIPRDLYVAVPGFGSTKINAAHAYGEQYGYEGGGPALVKATLAQALDIPIHYYVRANFNGFRQAIDTVGGVTLEVEEAIYDPTFPDARQVGFSPFQIAAGTQHLDGETALKYVRSRATTSDFDRARRQREVLSALRKKVLSAGTFTNPVRINSLMTTMGNNVTTDLKVGEILRLIDIAQQIENHSIISEGLDNAPGGLLISSNGAAGYVLVPRSGDFGEVQQYVRRLLTDGFIKVEGARIRLLNGTERPGLAQSAAELLESYGYDVVAIGDGPRSDYAQSAVYDHTASNPYSVRYLEQRFKSRAVRVPGQGNGDFDITIILGADYNL